MNYLETMEIKKIERVKELLEYLPNDRTDKMLLELMSFTKGLKLFENLAMTNEHKLVCKSMVLKNFKPNDVIVTQGDPGDSFYYILTGIVKIIVSKKLDINIDKDENKVTFDKYIGDLKAGQTFGELSLIYGTPRTATIISVTNSSLIKIDKTNFDLFVKDIFDNQLKDQIDFMKICPIFKNVSEAFLVRFAITTERKIFITRQTVLKSGIKCEYLYLIRRGNVRVVKPINFIKDDTFIRKKLDQYKNLREISYDNLDILNELNSEKVIDILSNGPTIDDEKNNNIVLKNITLESLKMGDIFPSYYSFNNVTLDVYYEAENPCDIIVLKLNDLQEIVNEAYKFIQAYSKPFPSDEFIRKFYYYNSIWNQYKVAVKKNIIADSINKRLINTNSMRQRLMNKKNIESIKLPSIFSNKQFPKHKNN